jgi:hypothetical protein
MRYAATAAAAAEAEVVGKAARAGAADNSGCAADGRRNSGLPPLIMAAYSSGLNPSSSSSSPSPASSSSELETGACLRSSLFDRLFFFLLCLLLFFDCFFLEAEREEAAKGLLAL